MLNKILAISGKPGLYRFLSRGNKMIIIESIDEAKKRMPAHAADKIVALSDISIYTDDGKEVPLADVFENAKKIFEAKQIDVHYKKSSQNEIVEVFSKILPQFDADRVHVSDMRKVIQWYNILTQYGLTDFTANDAESQETTDNPKPTADLDSGEVNAKDAK